MNSSNHRVNLIHTEDVARLIKHHLEFQLNESKVNLISRTNCTKSEFYIPMLKNKPELQVSDQIEKSFDLRWIKDCGFKLKYPDLQEYFKNLP